MNTVVILSGGMDSATLLYHLKVETDTLGQKLMALSFHYGQRHAKELHCAARIAELSGVPWQLVDLTALGSQALAGSSQTDRRIPVPQGHYAAENMKLTVVPNRNMIMLSVAAAYAISHGCEAIAYGAHAGDHAIYPDCRPVFVDAMQAVLHLCHFTPVILLTPFLMLSKGHICRRGLDLKVPFEDTWTCYAGENIPCGKCGACNERAEAFTYSGVADPLIQK